MRALLLLILSLLVGCSWRLPGATTAPLRISVGEVRLTAHGSVTELKIVLPARRHAQAVPENWDQAELTLSNATLMSASSTLTVNQAGGSSVSPTFRNLRPGAGYALTVKLLEGGTLKAQAQKTNITLLQGSNTVDVTLNAVTLMIQTIAGSEKVPVLLNTPAGVVLDAAGNLYIVNREGNNVQKFDAVTKNISTVAGTGSQGFDGDGGLATAAQLNWPNGIALDAAGNLYIADMMNHRVRKVDAVTKEISTVAGDGNPGFDGDEGPADDARLNMPAGVSLDAAGNLYIADVGNQRVRKVDAVTKNISTVAGGGTSGLGDNGPATDAQLSQPVRTASDAEGNLYITDYVDHRIRKVDANGNISTVAGDGTPGFSGDEGPADDARLNMPAGIALDAAGNLYIADSHNRRVRKVDAVTKNISTVAGTGNPSNQDYDDLGNGGPATEALLSPEDITLDAAGNLYIADASNYVRKFDAATGIITSIVDSFDHGFGGDGGPATAAWFYQLSAIALDAAGNLYITDAGNRRVRKVDAVTKNISTVAGTGTPGFNGDGGPATAAQLHTPYGIALDAEGNLYIADTGNFRVRKVDAVTKNISTVAGNGTQGFGGDGELATATPLGMPVGVALDAAGNLYFADNGTSCVRKVDAVTKNISTVAGVLGSQGFNQESGPATATQLDGPLGIALDAGGNLYIADAYNSRIRKVDAEGNLSTVVGDGSRDFGGDGGPPHLAQLDVPYGVALDAGGNLYIADTNNERVRKVGYQ